MSKNGIRIGAGKAAVREARKGVLAILGAGREEETTRAALRVFADICEVKNASVTDCTFTVGGPK